MARKKSPRRQEKRGIVIFCQGEKTEKMYFEKMKQLNRWHNVQVKSGASKDPLSMVRKELRQIKHESRGRLPEAIFFVCDKDETSEDNLRQAIQICNSYNKNKSSHCYLVLSNPKFEVWLYAYVGTKWPRGISDRELIQKLARNEIIGQTYGKQKKHLSGKFDPTSELQLAKKSAARAGLNEIGAVGTTAVADMIEKIEEICER